MPFWRFTWLTALGLAPLGPRLRPARPGGRRQLGTVAPPPADPRLPRRRRDRRPDRLRRSCARRGAGRPTRAGPAEPVGAERRLSEGARGGSRPARRRAGNRPGPGRAAAGLQLRPHRPRPLARRLGLGGDRPGAAQELRGGPARRRRAGAADRPAAHDRRGAAQLRRCAAALLLGLSFLPAAIVGYALRAADRAAAGRARGRPPTACSPARRRCSSPTAARSCAGAARRRPPTAWRSGVAQAAALAPGVSRNGVTLAAARWRALLPRPGEPALADDRAADHRRRHRASRASACARRGAAPELRRSLALGIGRLLRLDPRLAAPDRPGRARPGALALRRLPRRPRRRGSCQAAPDGDERMSDAYARAGVDQGAADSAVAGLVAGAGRDRARPPLAAGAAARPLRERDPDRRADRASRSPPTGSAPSCWSPRSWGASTRSGSTAWR